MLRDRLGRSAANAWLADRVEMVGPNARMDSAMGTASITKRCHAKRLLVLLLARTLLVAVLVLVSGAFVAPAGKAAADETLERDDIARVLAEAVRQATTVREHYAMAELEGPGLPYRFDCRCGPVCSERYNCGTSGPESATLKDSTVAAIAVRRDLPKQREKYYRCGRASRQS